MSLRLARRKDQHPYLRTIVAWSVTCIVGYVTGKATISGYIGRLKAKYKEREDDKARQYFSDDLYNQPLMDPAGVHEILPPQPQMWYRDGWDPCKAALIQRSLIDRSEYYTAQFRQWTYRLNYEMVIFGFQEGDVYVPNVAQQGPRYLFVTSNLLLAAAEEDDYPFNKIYSDTQAVAKQMVNTPGTTLFVKNTGYSIDDERPAFFAERIVEFLTSPVIEMH